MYKQIEKFNTELRGTNRPGIEDLIDSLEDKGFYTAPCSSQYHLCRAGGLLEHSLNVLKYARNLNLAWGTDIEDEHIVITALLHDIGKAGDHGKMNYIPYEDKYKYNSELFYIPHEIRSVVIASRYIELTEQEEAAILYHNGLYTSIGGQIKGNETPLYMIIHFSDLWASRIVEAESDGSDDL